MASQANTDILYNIGAPGGVMVLSLGLHALFRPLQALAFNFKYPIPTNTDEGYRFATSVMRLYGIRNFYVGLINLAIWYRGDRVLLGLSAMFGVGTALVDGIVGLHHLGRYDWVHFVVAFVSAGLSAALLTGANDA